MRKLTVIRRKTLIACISKIRIYAEDPEGDTVINGVKCRLLGKLKNNERATYEIRNESTRIYAVYDKISKGIFNDYYTVPAGEDDYYISGKSHYNPFCGNPFYFDGINDEEILANRKKNNKKAMAILIPILAVAAVGGFFLGYFVVRF